MLKILQFPIIFKIMSKLHVMAYTTFYTQDTLTSSSFSFFFSFFCILPQTYYSISFLLSNQLALLKHLQVLECFNAVSSAGPLQVLLIHLANSYLYFSIYIMSFFSRKSSMMRTFYVLLPSFLCELPTPQFPQTS